MHYFLQLVIGVYLGLAPIYWLPGISVDALSYIKMGLFFLATIATAIAGMISGRARLPPQLLGPLGLALCILSTSGGLFQSSSILIFEVLKNYSLVFSALWIFFILGQIKINVEKMLILASSIVATACAFVVMSKYGLGPDFVGPSQFVADHLWISGFGSLRTGWSNGVALYVAPLLLVFARKNTLLDIALKIIATIGITAIVCSQDAVAGRAGFIASIVIIGVAFSYPGKRKFLITLIATGSLLILLNLNSFYVKMRIVREDTGRAEVGNLDTISAGRLEGDIVGITSALENPLFGHGFGSITYGRAEIHNLWIRLAAESGFIPPILLLLIVYKVLEAAHKTSRNPRLPDKDRFLSRVYLGGILGGLFMTLVEPRMLLGTFQISIMWWVFAGIVSYRYGAAKRLKGSRQISSPPYLQLTK